jgi:Zn finger protein HypA/HybF involved in hydrogenase expression
MNFYFQRDDKKKPISHNPISRDLLVRGIASAKAGEKQLAYKYLVRYLSQEPPQKEQIDAMYYLSLVSPTESEQRSWIEKILTMDPTEGRARRQMAILNGELQPENIIDPDRLPGQISQQVSANDLERFVCPQCGGRMTFAADGQSLVCENCEVKSLREKSGGRIEETNFSISMVTGQGQSTAVNTLISLCAGCGAEFIIPVQQLSWQCPYCESNYAVVQKEERQILSPAAVIPFSMTESQAYQRLINWWNGNQEASEGKFEAMQGIYLPIWTFDIGGFIDWQLEVKENREWYPQSSTKALFYDDIRVPATRKFPRLMNELMNSFDFDKMVTFDSQYLANWMAESYQVPAGDAALTARKFALEAERQYFKDVNVQQIRNLTLNTSRVTVEQYKLVLVPVWSALLVFHAERFPVMINGQNGKLFSTFQNGEHNHWLSKKLRWMD